MAKVTFIVKDTSNGDTAIGISWDPHPDMKNSTTDDLTNAQIFGFQLMTTINELQKDLNVWHPELRKHIKPKPGGKMK